MRKLISLTLTLLIVLSGQTTQAAVKKTIIKPSNSAISSESKLTKEVQNQKGKPGKQEYLIQLNSTQDQNAIPFENYSIQGLANKKSNAKAVVNELKAVAAATQRPFIEKFKVNKIEYKSFFIANMLWVKTDYAQVEALAKDPMVKKVYINKIFNLLPEEPLVTNQAIPATIQWNIQNVKANEAWAMGVDGSGVVVGILDTGVDWTHPALKSKFRAYDPSNPSVPKSPELSYSWFDGVGGATVPTDDNSHGTHVAGTILGQTPNRAIGVAPGATWIAAKVIAADGSGSSLSLLKGGQWMAAPGEDATKAPDIINNSWGGGDNVDDWYREMVRNWRAAGILPVFAAGNQTSTEPAPWPGSIMNPAHYPESVAVGALTQNNTLATFSKLGPSPYDWQIAKPELSAPGVNINSSYPGVTSDPEGLYLSSSGTSMAAPHIAGAAALVLSANINLSVDEVLFAMEQTATPLVNTAYPSSPNMAFGYGIVNAKAAVDLVKAGLTKTTLKGQVVDETTGSPVVGAKVRLLENATMTAVATDQMGNYQFTDLLSGHYTIHVYHPKYGNAKKTVSLVPMTVNTANISVTYPGLSQTELSYDDGTEEESIVYEAGGSTDGYGVAFKPDRYGLLKNIKVYFTDEIAPPNASNTMELVIYEADQNMVPTSNRLMEPSVVEVLRGAWTTIDVSGYGISTDQPFVVALLQIDDWTTSPALSRDTGSLIGTNNSYFYSIGSGFTPIEYDESSTYTGSWMVRANLEYAMVSPSISNVAPVTLMNGSTYTSADQVNVSGSSFGAKRVGILVNGSLKVESDSVKGSFSGTVTLPEGQNKLKAALMLNGLNMVESEEVTVIKDSIYPVITVTAPINSTSGSKTLTISGTVEELNLAAFTISGQTVSPNGAGQFSHDLTIVQGENQIILKATDMAGHTTEKVLQITGVFEQGIQNSFPQTNQVIYSGETLPVQVVSNLTGAVASFKIGIDSTESIPLIETSPGVYENNWIVPVDFVSTSEKIAYQIDKAASHLTSLSNGLVTVRQTGISRVYGSNRFSTATNVSLNTFARADTVVLTNGLNFPDALVGGIYAATINAPVLFTRPGEIPVETMNEINRLGATHIKILGGTAAVSEKVETELRLLNFQIQRIWGNDRYSTAVQVASETNLAPAVIYLATGEDFADAMSIIPVAAKEKGILLLTGKNKLDPSTKAALISYQAQKVIILGGEEAIKPSVVNELTNMGIVTERIFGSDRFSTNIEIYKKYMGLTNSGIIATSGTAFPDALSSGVMAARFNQPLILVNPLSIKPITEAYLNNMSLKGIIVLGYTEAISENVYQQLNLMLN